jgi:hypothetical protein
VAGGLIAARAAGTKAVGEGEVKSPFADCRRSPDEVMAPFDLEACIQQLLRKQLLHEALLREICEKTKEVLMRESNVVHISAPVTVVGDIHGSVASPPSFSPPSLSPDRPIDGLLYHCSSNSSQFYDLIEIFRIGGYAPHTNYLFLGELLSPPFAQSVPPQLIATATPL